VLDLWRYGGGSFQAGELRLLATLARPVTAGLRAAIARTFAGPGRQLHPVGPAVVVPGPGLQVRSQTEAAAGALLRLNPPDEPPEVGRSSSRCVISARLEQRAHCRRYARIGSPDRLVIGPRILVILAGIRPRLAGLPII
jgi:hypothetical protein